MLHLKHFTTIEGIGAASGIYCRNGILYLIADDSAYLYQYNTQSEELTKIQILFNPKGERLENILKVNKPDFETLCFHEEVFYVFGSGSTANRNKMICYSLITKEVHEHDLTTFYAKLKQISGIDDENFNIEGVIFTGNKWMLFNRGNGSLSKNGVFRINGKALIPEAEAEFIPITLPRINHIESSFTDAVLLDKHIYFLAAAENTSSTYEDGEVLGSFIGCLNPEDLTVAFVNKISDIHKFEGLSIYKRNDQSIEFLLCEDKDSEEMTSRIYTIEVSTLK